MLFVQRNVFAFIALFNSIVLITCLTQTDIDQLMTQPKKFCGQTIPSTMKTFCRLENARNLRSKKSSKILTFFFFRNNLRIFSAVEDFNDRHKYDKALDHMLAAYEDGDSQIEDEGGDGGYDWFPNYLYMSRFHKRDGLTITQACCRQACTLETLLQYCPRRN